MTDIDKAYFKLEDNMMAAAKLLSDCVDKEAVVYFAKDQGFVSQCDKEFGFNWHNVDGEETLYIAALNPFYKEHGGEEFMFMVGVVANQDGTFEINIC